MYDNILQSRIDFEKLGTVYPSAGDITIDKVVIENIHCYWFRNKEKSNSNKIAIYLHGGCYVLGSIRSHQALVSHLAKEIALPIVFVEYSLAPEKPFPNAVNDVFKVFKSILIQYPKSDIILMGDSAGAGLSVSLLSKIIKHNLKPPGFMIMISPWIDLSCTKNSITENAGKDPVLKKERLLELASLYIGNQDLSNVNPEENLPEKFPSTLILVGSCEILLDDSKSIYNKIVESRAKAKLGIYDNQSHVWPLENIHTEQSQKAISEIKVFVNDRIVG